ncbi:MAG: phosphoglycerate dehydrogenase [Planctomycetota bacterium]|nr:phosphoglycerate dehydrogenase [Planctomycetota bacterium]
MLVCLVNYEKYCAEGRDRLKAAGYEVTFNPHGRVYRPEELHKAIADVDAVIADNEEWNEASYQAAPKLKVIAKFGVGLNNFDLEAAKRHNVVVANCAGLNANTVSEQTIALFLGMLKRIPQLAAALKRGEWPKAEYPVFAGRKAGLLGFGAIGKKVAAKLVGMGLEVSAYDKFPDAEAAAAIGVAMTGMEAVMRGSDYIFVHVPYLKETHHLVNDDTIAMMKEGVYLVNTARGLVVDEAAAARALDSGKMAGMASDVFEVEPPPADTPVFACDNYICTPHIAGDAFENMRANGLATAAIITDVFAGREPRNRQA